MTVIPIFELPGGIHPPEHKTRSMALPLAQLPLPNTLIVPLAQHSGEPAQAVVSVGQQVLKGQVIGEAQGVFSVNIHAPSSGKVIAIEPRPQAHPSGLADLSVVIETDGKDHWITRNPVTDYKIHDRAALLNKLRNHGVAGLGGAGFPTAVKLNPRSTHVIDTLIINGAECEPYITADDMLMQVYAGELIEGSLLIAHLLHNPARILIGVEDNKPKAIAALKKAAEGTAVSVVEFPTKYPSGGAKQLTQILTGREIPSGHHSAEVGVIVVNVGTAVASYNAIVKDEPLISRITTLAGDALSEERNLELLIGTPIDDVLAAQGFDPKRASRLIMGGPMMGFTLENTCAPIVKATNCLIAAGKKELPLPAPAQACIRCGLCAEACPASLLPQQLFWYAQADDQDRLKAHHLFDCIECGACSYVCPSSIPLVQYYRAAKGNIRQHDLEKEKADRSRRRFEFRQERMQREEAEKEAKRLARKKAAEEAKAKLAEKGPASSPSTTTNSVDPLQNALVKAQVNTESNSEQRTRLERLLATAKNSLQHAELPLEPKDPTIPITPEQQEKRLAKIKQCELKVADAQRKLDELSAINNATENSAMEAGIQRAQEKLSQSPRELLEKKIATVKMQLEKSQQRAAEAAAAQLPTAAAFTAGVANLTTKLLALEEELQALPESSANTPTTVPVAVMDAAQLAIDKARQRAADQQAMSPAEKLIQQRESLLSRIEKTRERVAQAEAEGSPTVEALRKGLDNLEQKLAALNSEETAE